MPPAQADVTTQAAPRTQPAAAAHCPGSDTQAVQLAQQPVQPAQQPAEPNRQPAAAGHLGTTDGAEASPPVVAVMPQQPVAIENGQQDVVMKTEQQNIDGSSRPELYRLPSNVDPDESLDALR